MNKEPSIKNFKTIIHISMTKQHQLKEMGEIVWEGNPIHGMCICVETITPKRKNGNFGKPKRSFYLNEKDSPMFDTTEEFIKHYSKH